ncbi:MAG: hypothetical protein IJY52_08675 [Anaerotignum sp.]|nr:hypothetical protein [Anaerotignum sp.]
MKKTIGLAMAVCSLVTATPAAAMAAEFPAVDVATTTLFNNKIYGYKDELGLYITMEKMNFWEVAEDAFVTGGEFVFTPEGQMQFADQEAFVVEEGTLKAECKAEDGSLVVQVLQADEKEREVLCMPELKLICEGDPKEKETYALYADYHLGKETVKDVKVVEDFVRTTHNYIASENWKVVVPVEETYLFSNGKKVEMDTAAYLSKDGYTMLPVRAVANAFGVHPKNVIWNAEDKTVTLLNGQQIIMMKAGEKKILENGTILETSAAMEIVNGRAFLPMRDLGNVLGATNITWDNETKTAFLSGLKR